MLFFICIYLSTALKSTQQQLSSAATIEQGIESLSQAIADLSIEISSAIQSIDRSMNSLTDYTAEVSNSIIDSQLEILFNLLERVDASIKRVKKEISIISGKCKEFLDCDTCSTNSYCVWCMNTSSCIEGDELGSYVEACTDFSYGTCKSLQCKDHGTCSLCTSKGCNWCSSPEGCFESDSDDSKSCPEKNSFNRQGKSCIKETDLGGSLNYNSKFVYSNPSLSKDPAISTLESLLNDLYSQSEQVKNNISILRNSKSQISEEAKEVTSLKVEEFKITKIDEKTGAAQSAYTKELNEIRENIVKDENNAAEKTIGIVDQNVAENSIKVLEEIDITTGSLQKDIEKLKKNVNKSIKSIEETLKEIEERANITNSNESYP